MNMSCRAIGKPSQEYRVSQNSSVVSLHNSRSVFTIQFSVCRCNLDASRKQID